MTNTNTLLADLTDYQAKVTEANRILTNYIIDRNNIALELHNAGMSVTAIGNHIGVSRQTVHKIIRQARERQGHYS